jgi:hypothetical protein
MKPARFAKLFIYFKDLPDARQIDKVKYPVGEILLLRLLAIVAGAETITDIARPECRPGDRAPNPTF